ncbi:MAG: HEPN domain-containing protein [Candidatus Falkowbacteria bacterium]|nr:HEPN domain-containing protein [Candidatus Falkowbacteria bacterium]
MSKLNVAEIIQYWKKTAEHDFHTMEALFVTKQYSNSLFFGHIVLEKILKANVVKRLKQNAPAVHNLVYLEKIAKLNLQEDEKDFLGLVDEFNIRTRYPDYKLEFYKKYNNKKITEEKLLKIKELYKKLWKLL